jgi:hypothetical protein
MMVAVEGLTENARPALELVFEQPLTPVIAAKLTASTLKIERRCKLFFIDTRIIKYLLLEETFQD